LLNQVLKIANHEHGKHHGLAINNMPPPGVATFVLTSVLKRGCQDELNFGALSLSGEKPASSKKGRSPK